MTAATGAGRGPLATEQSTEAEVGKEHQGLRESEVSSDKGFKTDLGALSAQRSAGAGREHGPAGLEVRAGGDVGDPAKRSHVRAERRPLVRRAAARGACLVLQRRQLRPLLHDQQKT